MWVLDHALPLAPPAPLNNAAPALARVPAQLLSRMMSVERRRRTPPALGAVAAAPPARTRPQEGHSALDLGALGDIAPQQMAQLLRLAHIRCVYNHVDLCKAWPGARSVVL